MLLVKRESTLQNAPKIALLNGPLIGIVDGLLILQESSKD
jgi:hypothetical protein